MVALPETVRRTLELHPLVRKILLGSGAAASAWYVAMDVVGSLRYEGYSYRDQTISELAASGAPTRTFMVLANGIPYSLLMGAFAEGVWTSIGETRAGRITRALLVGSAIVGPVGWFVPMDRREVLAAGKRARRNAMHLPWGGTNVFLFLTTMGFGAGLLGNRFRYYSYGTIVTIVGFGALVSAQRGRLTNNDPTPWMGIEERVSVYATMLWFATLAIGLLRAEGVNVPSQLGTSALVSRRLLHASP